MLMHVPMSICKQTLNIISHAVGGIFFASLALRAMIDTHELKLGQRIERRFLAATLPWPQDEGTARWPLVLYLCCCCLCLFTSSIAHMFANMRKEISQKLWRADYASIAVLIVSSHYPVVHALYTCTPHVMLAYLVVLTALALLLIGLSLHGRFQTNEWRNARAVLFASLGSLGILPVVHQIQIAFSQGSMAKEIAEALMLEMCMGTTYLLGAFLYARRIPERWAPRSMSTNVFFNSHASFHMCTVAGAILHYYAATLFLEYRDRRGCSLTAFPNNP